ncbi:hypothetical protein EI94DRAFT_1697337 [Lactarius quietus]|nr:hypothetical protein EI94DRAFT_1697337 [Lactarius quietus]
MPLILITVVDIVISMFVILQPLQPMVNFAVCSQSTFHLILTLPLLIYPSLISPLRSTLFSHDLFHVPSLHTSSITSVRTNTSHTTTTRTAEKTAPDDLPCAQPRTQPHAPKDGGNSEDTLSDPEAIEVKSDDSVELVEDDDAELDWDAPIYTFFKPMPVVEYIDQHKAHVFEYAAHSCHGRS